MKLIRLCVAFASFAAFTSTLSLNDNAYADSSECEASPYMLEALLCARAPEPIVGIFGTWKNMPITYTGDTYPGTWTWYTMQVSTASDSWLSVGLEAMKQPSGTAYGPIWEERGQGQSNYQAIAPARGPAEPDGINNTYMAIRAPGGTQWEILYNYNHVATTSYQSTGNVYDLNMSLTTFDPPKVTVSEIENRPQYMTGNRYWSRFSMGSTVVATNEPLCGNAGSQPQYCYASSLSADSSGNKLAAWKVSKPNPSTNSIQNFKEGNLNEALSGEIKSKTFNGVDQKELAECMINSPSQCLSTVQGLAECIEYKAVCNVTSLEQGGLGEAKSTKILISEAEIRSLAELRFSIEKTDFSVIHTTGSSYEELAGVNLPSFWSGVDVPLLAVYSNSIATDKDGSRFEGVIAAYDANTAQLVHACFGLECASFTE